MHLKLIYRYQWSDSKDIKYIIELPKEFLQKSNVLKQEELPQYTLFLIVQ